jgi:membrane-bound lytic murein transglycosylase D
MIRKLLCVALLAILPLMVAAQQTTTPPAPQGAITTSDNAITAESAIKAEETTVAEPSVDQLDSLLMAWSKEYSTIMVDKLHNEIISTDGVNLEASKIPDSIYVARLKNMGSSIPMSYNQEVRKYIISYTTRNKGVISRALGRSQVYFPIFEEALMRYNMPLELKLLPVIESALNPKARSKAGASGLWQFMYRTALGYKLQMTSFIDQRFDPVLATDAACRYLLKLYGMYNDWNLALAAYNCGPGNVNKAIRKADSKDFWKIYPYLPTETRNYLPAFIAVNYAYTYHKEHGIKADEAPLPLETDTVHISRIMHLQQISSTIGTPIEVLRGLNPQFVQDIVPAVNGRSYDITLPLSEVGKFIDHEQEIMAKDVVYLAEYMSPEKNGEIPVFVIDSKIHVVEYGESLSVIAEKYNVTVNQICKWNNISDPGKIRIGQKLEIFLK